MRVFGSGYYRELLNSNSEDYGGNGLGNFGGVEAEAIPSHGRAWSIKVLLPPLAALIFATR